MRTCLSREFAFLGRETAVFLFDGDEVSEFVKLLKPLQDDLGYANDVRVANELLADLRPSDAAIARAAGIVLHTDCAVAYRRSSYRDCVRGIDELLLRQKAWRRVHRAH